MTKGLVDPLTGPIYVKVVKPATWERNEPLTVCALVQSNGVVGFLPMPNGGWLCIQEDSLSIEIDDETTPTGTPRPLWSAVGGSRGAWCA